MNPNYIGVGNKIINLDAIAMIEDMTGDGEKAETVIVLTTTNAAEIEIAGPDAEAILARAEFMLDTTDAVLARVQAMQQQNATTEVQQT